MKRVCFSLMVLALFGGGSAAMAQGVTGGVKGGITFATVNQDAAGEFELGKRTGVVVGGFVTWPVGDRLGIQLEGLYTQKGTTFSATLDGFSIEGTTKLDYFEVPVLLVVSTAPPRSRRPSIQFFGGPSVAVKVSAKNTGSFEGETTDSDIPDENISRIDLGVVVGAGVTIGHFTIDGRYTMGLSNLNTDDSDPTKVRNRALAVLAGIRF